MHLFSSDQHSMLCTSFGTVADSAYRFLISTFVYLSEFLAEVAKILPNCTVPMTIPPKIRSY